MTDQLARLRTEIEADIDEHLGRIEREERRVQVLREVLERMTRIEAECPAPAAASEPAGRAPRRDVQGAIMSAVNNDPHGVTAEHIRKLSSRLIGDVTESACNRALAAMVGSGKLVLVGDRYHVVGGDIADTERRVPRPVDAAAQ